LVSHADASKDATDDLELASDTIAIQIHRREMKPFSHLQRNLKEQSEITAKKDI
jgi:hypothetical protein